MKKFLNEGFRSKAYLVDNRIILEGINEESFKKFEKDYELIKIIFKYIQSIQIPNNLQLINPCKDYPYGALSYDYIDGVILKPELITKKNKKSIIKDIVIFLKEIHQINIIAIEPNFNKDNIIVNEKEKVIENIKELFLDLDNKCQEKIIKWQEEYFKYLDNITEFTFVHNDFWYENIIISNDHNYLIGVIDFENSAIFDKALDFVPFFYISEDFLKDVIKEYGLNKDYLKIIKMFYVRREIISFKYIKKYFNDNEIKEQIEKVINAISD